MTHTSFTFSSRTAVIPSPFAVSAECGHLLDFVVWIHSARELLQTNIFKQVTSLNIDGIWLNGRKLNFLLLLEVFCGFLGVLGAMGDLRSVSKARLWSLQFGKEGSRKEESSGSLSSKTGAGWEWAGDGVGPRGHLHSFSWSHPSILWTDTSAFLWTWLVVSSLQHLCATVWG